MRIPIRKPASPGKVFKEAFLDPMIDSGGIQSQSDLADQMGVSRQRLNELFNRDRDMTADLAEHFEKRLHASAQFWMLLQVCHELWLVRHGK